MKNCLSLESGVQGTLPLPSEDPQPCRLFSGRSFTGGSSFEQILMQLGRSFAGMAHTGVPSAPPQLPAMPLTATILRGPKAALLSGPGWGSGASRPFHKLLAETAYKLLASLCSLGAEVAAGYLPAAPTGWMTSPGL